MAEKVTSEDFKEKVLNASGPVMVQFFATWCGPCKMLSPVVDEVAQEVEGKAKVYKLDVDESQPVALTYGVMSVPTILVFKDGLVQKQAVGVQSKDTLLGLLNVG
ncbi:MAG: thioredoxin [Eggerthellaceae bacterium]